MAKTRPRRESAFDPSMSLRSHDTAIRVRYCECDPMGVVHHANYAIWFEMGRTEMLRSQGGNYRDLEAAGRFLRQALAEPAVACHNADDMDDV